LALFENEKVEVNVRASSKGKYTSISIAGKFGSPDIIIQKHKRASKIPNIIQL
jgi:putative lipoic acid-binding regulatory protein